MSRTSKKKKQQKKKTVKKKTAVAKRSAPKVDQAEIDAWVTQQNKQSPSCMTCANRNVAETLDHLLRSMIRNRAYRIPIRAIREMILTKHPDAKIGQRSFERHLRMCVRDLYDKARGRNR